MFSSKRLVIIQCPTHTLWNSRVKRQRSDNHVWSQQSSLVMYLYKDIGVCIKISVSVVNGHFAQSLKGSDVEYIYIYIYVGLWALCPVCGIWDPAFLGPPPSSNQQFSIIFWPTINMNLILALSEVIIFFYIWHCGTVHRGSFCVMTHKPFCCVPQFCILFLSEPIFLGPLLLPNKQHSLTSNKYELKFDVISWSFFLHMTLWDSTLWVNLYNGPQTTLLYPTIQNKMFFKEPLYLGPLKS